MDSEFAVPFLEKKIDSSGPRSPSCTVRCTSTCTSRALHVYDTSRVKDKALYQVLVYGIPVLYCTVYSYRVTGIFVYNYRALYQV